MQTYDLIMFAVLAIATLYGFWKGLAWQVASLGAVFASYLVAYKFHGPFAEIIMIDRPWSTFVAMLVLYVGTSMAIWIGFRAARRWIDRLRLQEFDRQLGAVLGAAKGVLLCVIITLFSVTLLGEDRRQAIIQSHSGYYIARLLNRSHGVLPEEIHKVLEPYLHSLDGGAEQGVASERVGGLNPGENWTPNRT